MRGTAMFYSCLCSNSFSSASPACLHDPTTPAARAMTLSPSASRRSHKRKHANSQPDTARINLLQLQGQTFPTFSDANAFLLKVEGLDDTCLSRSGFEAPRSNRNPSEAPYSCRSTTATGEFCTFTIHVREEEIQPRPRKTQ